MSNDLIDRYVGATLRTVPAYQRIPAFLFSTLAEAEGHRRSVQCGATAFVPKPGNLQAFVEAVATMVRRSIGGGRQCGRYASKPAVNSWAVWPSIFQMLLTLG